MVHVITEYLLYSLCHVTTERLLRDTCFIKLSENKYLFSFSYVCLLFGIFSIKSFTGSKAGELFKCTWKGHFFAGYTKKHLQQWLHFFLGKAKEKARDKVCISKTINSSSKINFIS